MAAVAPQAWQYCCRLGTHDPRGNNARKNVAAGKKKHCHGTTKHKEQRRWSQVRNRGIVIEGGAGRSLP